MSLHTTTTITMNQYDVNMLDAAVHDGSHWMGCILCPSLDGDNSGEGKEASYNLLMREKVQFWKIQMLMLKIEGWYVIQINTRCIDI